MYNKKLRKIFAACALATALTMATGSISVFAAEGDTPTSGAVTKLDPTTEDNPDTSEDESKVGTDIDVWGYTNNKIVYSVDVEWGAMTFEYEASSWDPVEHKKIAGAGWQVYDSEADKALTATQDAINKVTVTNHSNAGVYAQLSYTSEADYSDTSGNFANTVNAAENIKATWDDTNKYFTLATASTDASGSTVADGAEGTASVGNVYFTPDSLADGKSPTKWTKIGKITVAITTEAPTP